MTLDVLAAIWTVLGAGVVGLIGWYVRIRYETNQRERERLNDERRRIYLQILEPNIRLFAGISDPAETEKALTQVASFKHRQVMFELNLMGSDEVVRALNHFMQDIYHNNNTPPLILTNWGHLLLAIRKDLGNKGTKLNEKDMLSSQVKDIDQLMPE